MRWQQRGVTAFFMVINACARERERERELVPLGRLRNGHPFGFTIAHAAKSSRYLPTYLPTLIEVGTHIPLQYIVEENEIELVQSNKSLKNLI